MKISVTLVIIIIKKNTEEKKKTCNMNKVRNKTN